MCNKLYALVTIAIVLFVTSCSENELSTFSPEELAQVQLSIDVENKLATRVISDGAGANTLGYAIYDEEDDTVARLKAEFEPQGIKVFPISAVSGKGVKELLYCVREMLSKLDSEPVVFEREYFTEVLEAGNEPYSVYMEEEGVFVVEGPRIERMLGYTNLDSEKGFDFFQKFMRTNGILDELEALGIEEGDTVRIYGFEFDYYK